MEFVLKNNSPNLFGNLKLQSFAKLNEMMEIR